MQTDTSDGAAAGTSVPRTGRLAACFEKLGEIGLPPPLEHQFAWTLNERVTLGPDVLAHLATLLTPQQLAALGSTCKDLARLSAATYPGIKLRLYPHQRASLAFMLKSEADLDRRGGILADEPGTGKTVTTLALLAKTAGVL